MQRKTILAASLAAFALMGMNAAKAEDTIAVIVKATTSEYWQWVFKGAEDAGKQLGLKVDKLGTPKDDAAGQIAVLESAAALPPTSLLVVRKEAYSSVLAPESMTMTGMPALVTAAMGSPSAS